MVLENEKSKSMMSSTMKGLTAVSTAEYIIWGGAGRERERTGLLGQISLKAFSNANMFSTHAIWATH